MLLHLNTIFIQQIKSDWVTKGYIRKFHILKATFKFSFWLMLDITMDFTKPKTREWVSCSWSTVHQSEIKAKRWEWGFTATLVQKNLSCSCPAVLGQHFNKEGLLLQPHQHLSGEALTCAFTIMFTSNVFATSLYFVKQTMIYDLPEEKIFIQIREGLLIS